MARNTRPDRGEVPLGDPNAAEHPEVADFVIPDLPRAVVDPLDDLDFDEPEAPLDFGNVEERNLGDINDLEDFATEEHVPVLPWSLTAEVIETGTTIPAILDPTRAETVLEGPSSLPNRFTVRLRMIVATLEPERVPGERVQLRVGRDVLAGRALILVE